MSPSTRRAWIEIIVMPLIRSAIYVALHPEGVDRNLNKMVEELEKMVALHPEGVDRNCALYQVIETGRWSPSTRRAWIEITV